MRTWLCAAALATVLAGCSSVTNGANGSEWGARDICEQFIGQRLKSPGSAEYEFTHTIEYTETWVAQGYVDSQNGFGAMLRSEFACEVSYQGDDRWRLVDLELT